jgi:hypothetical protein
MAIIKTIAVGAVALSLASGALASDISVRVAGANAANDNGASSMAEHTTVNVVSTVAANVMATLTGGEKPTTMTKHDEVSAQANAKPKGGEKADKAKDQPEANDTDADNNDEQVDKNDNDNDADNDNDEHGQKPAQTGTSTTKPGWGCGDKNHTHSGPPGNPTAAMPKGCEKKH